MTEIKIFESNISLNKKDFISSFDQIDDMILINCFDSGINIYKFNEKTNEIKFIENLNFEEKILCAKFLRINNQIFVCFCCFSEEKIKNSCLYSIKIFFEESDLKFSEINRIKNLNEFTTNFSFYSFTDIKKNNIDYFIVEYENSKKIYFYEIKLMTENDEIFIEMKFQLDLDDLDFIHYTLLKENNLFILAGISNEDFDPKDEEKNNDNNIIRFYRIENNEINFLSEIFNPLKEITNSIEYSNNSGFIIGSLSGRVCVFSNITLNNNDELEFNKFSFKSQSKIIDDQQLFFPITCIDTFKE